MITYSKYYVEKYYNKLEEIIRSNTSNDNNISKKEKDCESFIFLKVKI